MMAELVMRERQPTGERSFVEIVIWRLPRTLPGSAHDFKYRLAFVVDGICVLRYDYDNEAGKGDHRHVGTKEERYTFTTVEKLLADFWADVDRWER